MITLLLSLLGAAGISPLLCRKGFPAGYFIAAVPALGALWLAFYVEPETVSALSWFPGMGADFILRLDSLGRMMALLVLGIGVSVTLFAQAYLGKDKQLGRFLLILYIFMMAMVGIVLSDNVLLLFVFWELTSVSSYLLIGYKHEQAKARGHALQALLVTGFGGVAMLAGLIILAQLTGTWRISEMISMAGEIKASPMYPAALLLVLLGAFTKSAQFPFHFWLPNAMSAPTPVSAFLHSATMVKAGVFLLARMDPVLGGTPMWQGILLAAGLTTFLLGAIAGACQTDLKRVLAYTTASILGALTALVALPGEKAKAAFLFLLVAHALYKASLFIVVGTIDHACKTRDGRELGKLARVLPLTAAAALLAAASKAGLPFLAGFLAKEKGYMATLGYGTAGDYFVTGVFLLGNMLMVALALRVGFAPFWLKAKGVSKGMTGHGGPGFWMASLFLSLFGIFVGSAVGWGQQFLILGVLGDWIQTTPEMVLKIWHGFNLPLLLSVVTLLGGVGMFLFFRSAFWLARTDFAFRDPVERCYEVGLDGCVRGGGWLTSRLQSGDLRQYIAVVAGVTVVLVAFQFRAHGFLPDRFALTPISAVPVVASLLIMVGAVGAVVARRRFQILIWLSVVGFATAWWFLYYSGPDLALTLLSVETITLLLLALSFHRVPDVLVVSSAKAHTLRFVIAALGGITIALLLFKAKWVELGSGLGQELLARSLPDGKGANAVNVILVDFRALDTFGEITVLAVAAIGIASLMQIRKRGRKDSAA